MLFLRVSFFFMLGTFIFAVPVPKEQPTEQQPTEPSTVHNNFMEAGYWRPKFVSEHCSFSRLV